MGRISDQSHPTCSPTYKTERPGFAAESQSSYIRLYPGRCCATRDSRPGQRPGNTMSRSRPRQPATDALLNLPNSLTAPRNTPITAPIARSPVSMPPMSCHAPSCPHPPASSAPAAPRVTPADGGSREPLGRSSGRALAACMIPFAPATPLLRQPPISHTAEPAAPLPPAVRDAGGRTRCATSRSRSPPRGLGIRGPKPGPASCVD